MESNTPGHTGDHGASPNSEGELTKEKLAVKCKNLLVIAQKAKSARDDAVQEKEELQKTLEQTNNEVRKKEQQLNTANEMLAALTSQKLKLAMDIEDYKTAKARSAKELENVLELKEKTETEAESYKRQYKRVEKENDELIFRLQEKEKREAELLSDIRKLHENNESIKVISNSIAQEKQELEQLGRSLKSEVNKLLTEKNVFDQLLKEKYHLNYSNLNDLDRILDVKLREIRSNDSIIRDNEALELQDKIQKLTAELEEVNADRDKTMANLEEVRIETKQLIDNSDKLMEEIEVLKSEKDHVESQLNSSVLERNQDLKRFNEDVNKHELEIGRLKDELMKLKKDSEDKDVIKDENSRMKEELETLIQTNLELKNKLSYWQNATDSFRKNLQDVTHDFNDVKSQESVEGYEILDFAIEKLRTFKPTLEVIRESTERLAQLEEDRRQETRYEELNTSYQELWAESEAKKAVIDNLNSVIDEHESKSKDLLEKINELEKTLQENESCITKLQDEIEKKNEESANELLSRKKENDTLLCRVKDGESQIKVLMSTLNKLEEDKQQREEALVQKQHDIERLSHDLKETKRQLSDSRHGEDLKTQLELRAKEIIEKDSVISELTQKLNSTTAKSEKELKNMEASMKSEIAKLKTMFEEKNKQIENLTIELQQSQTRCITLESAQEELEQSLEQMKSSMSDTLKTQSDKRKSQAEIIACLKSELESAKELVNFKTLELEEINRIWAGRLNSYKVPLIGLKKISVDLTQQYETFRSEFIRVLNCLRESVNANIVRLIDNTKKELLDEMHHMNEVLKERGTTISKLQDSMAELQTKFDSEKFKVDEFKKEIENYEEIIKRKDENLSSKENQLRELENEITRLRDMKDTSTDTDVLSTSTISKTEEHSRLKEVDESIEDKYVKLRQIAVKLKKRNVELNQSLESERVKFTSEKTELMEKLQNLTVVAKNSQKVQESCDRLLDDFEAVKAKNTELNLLVKELTENEDNLKLQVSALLSDSQKLPILKKQIDSLNLSIKDLKSEVQRLRNEKESEIVKSDELNKQSKQLEDEVRTLKQSLDQAVHQGRCSNVLELELQNYQKVVEGLNGQILLERSKVIALEEENSSTKLVQSGLEEQIIMLEGQIKAEEERSNDLKVQLKNIKEEHEKSQIQTEEVKKHAAELRKELMASKNKCEQCTVEMSALSSEFSKKEIQMQSEITSLKSHVQTTEANLRTAEQEITSLRSEIDHLRREFESYRLRAQNTLAKQKGDSISLGEKEAKDQVEKLQKELSALQLKLEASLAEVETVNSRLSSVQLGKSRSDQRCEELKKTLQQKIVDIDRINAEFKAHKLLNESSLQSLKSEWNEKEFTLKSENESLKEIISKLNYQLEEKEIEIKNGQDSQQSTMSYFDDNMLQEREDAEGSESEPTQAIARRLSNVVPLDVLLSSPIDDENKVPTLLDKLEKSYDEIRSYETRTKHLTSLLSEAEKDAARSLHQNSILKEELRRLERSLERQPHMANNEYLKNVVLKFLTLHSGDEKSRLVPVLDTILKLSPEETNKLQAVAKGDSSWGSYLHSWTGI